MEPSPRATALTRARIAVAAAVVTTFAITGVTYELASAQATSTTTPTTAAPTTITPTTQPMGVLVGPDSTTTSAAPTTTAAATTTAAPSTTAAATTVAPTTAAPTTLAPTTTEAAPVTTTPAQSKSTTKKSKAADVGNPAARGATSIEVDISSQTLSIYKGGTLYRRIPVSTGSGKRYCSGKSCSIAHTPRGRFRIYNRIGGWRTSHLGRLYNPLYFSGGYAIHGGSLPGYPASHGCVRISMSSARWFPSVIPNGTPVYVHD